MKKTIKYLTLALLLPITSYFLLSYFLIFFPKKPISSQLKEKKEREVYLLYSEMHTDIVFNLQDLNSSLLKEFETQKRGFLAFGWGDKGIYMNTATWDDIDIFTSLKALFVNTPSVMHVAYYPHIHYYKSLKTIQLTRKEFKHLKESILKDFTNKKKVYHGFQKNDFFYDAKGAYNLFHTCNTWTGDKLREANVSMSYWTPLSQNVTASLP